MTLLGVFDQLLRDRANLFARIDDEHALRELARAFILITAVAGAIFGAAVGAYRGGIQVPFAALKVPMILLLTAAVCAPCWTALRAAVGLEAQLRSELVRILGGLAMVALVLAATTPFLLVGVALTMSYHAMAMILCGCACLAGLAGVGVLFQFRRPGAYAVPASVFLMVFVIVGAQMSWTLRPYLVRPRTPDVPFVRQLEGSLLDSAVRSWSSMSGSYDRDHAPMPGEADPWR